MKEVLQFERMCNIKWKSLVEQFSSDCNIPTSQITQFMLTCSFSCSY